MCFTLPEGFSVDASDWYDTSEKVESEDIMIEEVRNFVRIHSSLDKEQFMKTRRVEITTLNRACKAKFQRRGT